MAFWRNIGPQGAGGDGESVETGQGRNVMNEFAIGFAEEELEFPPEGPS